MAACLLCSQPASIGVLCTGHGVAIASGGLTTEQILSRVTEPGASLVDAWGFPHPVASGTTIGRDPTCGLAVMHASVSSTHAELRETDGTAGRWSTTTAATARPWAAGPATTWP